MLKQLFLVAVLVYACRCIKKDKKNSKGKNAGCGMDAKIDDALNSATQLRELYEEYRIEHCVDHPDEQEDMRVELFRQQLLKLQKFKKDKSVSWDVGITHLAHLTECEKELFHGHNDTKHYGQEDCEGYTLDDGDLVLQGLTPSTRPTLPPTWDWRNQHAVTPVKEKISNMASGWAHAALTPIETAIFRHTGELHELSVQELIDCTYHGAHEGLNKEDGNVRDAWEYITGHHRIGYAVDIPETGTKGVCNEEITNSANAFEGFYLAEERRLPPGDYDDYYIQHAVSSIAPVVVSMDAGNAHLDTYKGGAYNWATTNCDNSYQHAMAIVGYVREYWILKNNWGTKWGDNGYMWWTRHIKGYNCNLLKKPFVPIVKVREEKDPTEGDHY